jgi:hypothetical protein
MPAAEPAPPSATNTRSDVPAASTISVGLLLGQPSAVMLASNALMIPAGHRNLTHPQRRVAGLLAETGLRSGSAARLQIIAHLNAAGPQEGPVQVRPHRVGQHAYQEVGRPWVSAERDHGGQGIRARWPTGIQNGTICRRERQRSLTSSPVQIRRYTGDPVKRTRRLGVGGHGVGSPKSSSPSLTPRRKTNRCRSVRRASMP